MLYENLPVDTTSIRLLELLPAENDDDPVSCRLTVLALDANKTYTALSYMWNHAQGPEIIHVNENATGVGGNLASALRHMRTIAFRKPSPLSTLIWADGVCINQNNEEEKSKQVQLMGTIYSKASTVVSWLGADKYGEMAPAVTAIKIIQHVQGSVPSWLRDMKWMFKYPLFLERNTEPKSPAFNQVWTPLISFFLAPYWRRVWVLQEMVLAQNLWVMVGQHILDYEGVRSAVQLLSQLSSKPKLGEGIVNDGLLESLRFNGHFITAPHLIVDEMRKYTRTTEQLSDTDRIDAIFLTLHYQATNPKDKVFALQGLFDNFMTPDYGKGTVEVYSELMSKYIADSGSLFLMWFSGALLHPPDISEPGLPSWVPDLQALSLAGNWKGFPTQTFDSDRGMNALCSSQARVLAKRYLRVNACICGTISEAEPIFNTSPASFVHLYRKFIEKKADIENRTKVSYLQAILRTIVADISFKDQNPCSESDSLSNQRLFLGALYSLEGCGSSQPIIDTLRSSIEELGIDNENHCTSFLQTAFPNEIIHECWASEQMTISAITGPSDHLRPYLARFRDKRHHLFQTQTGYIGSSRDGIQSGDTIGVVQGCPYPVLLRKNGTQYMYLGTCYVLGLLNGEAAERVKEGSLTMEEIDLV